MIKKIIRGFLYGITALVLVGYFAVWGFSPMLARSVLTEPLSAQGVVLSDTSHIRYNPFISHLRIENLTWQRQGKTAFAIESAEFEIDLHKLLDREIVIRIFNVSGVALDVQLEGDTISVAGIELPGANPNTDEEGAAATESDEFPFTVFASQVVFNNLAINLDNGVAQHVINVDQLEVSEVEWSGNQQSLRLAIAGSIDDSAIALGGTLDMDDNSIAAAIELDWDNIQLANFTDYLPVGNRLRGEAGIVANSSITISDGNAELTIPELELSLTDFIGGQPPLHTELAQQGIRFEDLSLSYQDGAVANIRGRTHFNNNGLAVSVADTETTLMSLASTKIDNIDFNLPTLTNSRDWRIYFPALIFDDLQISQISDQLPPLSSIAKVSIEQLELVNDVLSVNKIVLDTLRAYVEIDNDKNLISLAQLPEFSVQEKSTVNVAEPDKPQVAEQSSSFIIGEINIVGDSEVQFIDRSVSPNYARTFFVDALTLGAINSELPQTPSPFVFRGRSDQYAKINLTGQFKPLADKLNFSVTGDLREFDLPAISTYVQSLGLELQTGQLDAKLNVQVADAELSGETRLLLRGVDIAKADAITEANLVGQTAMPLNVALGMLKDGDGNIRLNIPLTGSVDDPAFGLGNFVSLVTKKAILTATKSYVLDAFVPYAKVLTVAMSAGELVMQARFEDLIYEPAQVAFAASQKEYADELIQLLNKKPGLQFKVCGIATAAEASQLPATTPAEIDSDGLRNIAEQRAGVLKDYLVNRGNIASARVLLCNPEIDMAATARPRLEIRL